MPYELSDSQYASLVSAQTEINAVMAGLVLEPSSSSSSSNPPTSSSSGQPSSSSSAPSSSSSSAPSSSSSSPAPSNLYLPVRYKTTDFVHRDWGGGTDVGGNTSGRGYLYDHPSVAGRQARGLTATPTAQASPAAGSDSVYLWDPTYSWTSKGHDVWMRTSFYFPTKAFTGFLQGEAPFSPTTGNWNYLLVWHTATAGAGPSNVQFDVVTDYPVTESPGNNPRLLLRLDSGTKSSPKETYYNLAGQSSGNSPILTGTLPMDQWIDIILHMHLDDVNGIVDWYVNGVQVVHATPVPTLWTPTDAVSLTTCNYRLHATWASTVFMGPTALGPTLPSVQAAF